VFPRVDSLDEIDWEGYQVDEAGWEYVYVRGLEADDCIVCQKGQCFQKVLRHPTRNAADLVVLHSPQSVS
jgi:hypothetical protein